jgi:hypothetical protein
MPIVAILEWPPGQGVDMKAEYARVADELNGGRPFADPSDWGGGLMAHVAVAPPDGGGMVIDVWEDQASMDAWMARVTPLLEDAPEPQVRVLPTHNVVTGAPVRA